MNSNRVVITGMGVVAPNGVGLEDFTAALKGGKSGIRLIDELVEKKFACQIGGVPPLTDAYKSLYLSEFQQKLLVSESVIYGILASLEAWSDAGLEIIDKENELPDWDSGCYYGTGFGRWGRSFVEL